MSSHTILFWCGEKSTQNTKYLLALIKEDQNFKEGIAMWTCFKSWPMKNIFRNYKPMRVWLWLVYQIYPELLLPATFLRVHSNSKEVSYLYWQNTYPNLKTNCHIKLNLFLWSKLIEHLLLAKYLISVAVALIC